MPRCYCRSVSEGRVRMTTHLEGCPAVEDHLGGSCYDDLKVPYYADDAGRQVAHEPGPDDQTLADTYQRHAEDLEAIDDAYADDSWRTGWT
jgi:hypothetical protein